MYVRVKSIDGKKMVTLQTSKLMNIRDFKLDIAMAFGVPIGEQRLFFRGKQLEDCHRLFDYDINLNDVIQLMVKQQAVFEVDKAKVPKDTPEIEQENITETEYYKVGDLIDAKDSLYGAWFEAKIVSITRDIKIDGSNDIDEVTYNVQLVDERDDSALLPLPLNAIRPRAHHEIPFDEVQEGDRVMINYNLENPDQRGFWYDFVIRKIKNGPKSKRYMVGTIYAGVEDTSVEDCKIIFVDEIMRIENHIPVASRDDNSVLSKDNLRKKGIYCTHCNDNPRRKCKECGCRICGLRKDPEQQIMCDECNYPFHIWCLQPPLQSIPDDEWYCPDCKNDDKEIVKAGEKLKESKKKSKMASGLSNCNRDWGKGMGCVGRTKQCTIVPSNHFGPIPGVEVGTTWKFRLQVSEAGVHRPHVAGIHGRESEGAYSIVLSGGYEDDVDNGEEFLYTGSGGRDLSGNKRTASQSSDQLLTRMNKALALNCNAKINENGAEAKDWRKGKPVRVVRNYKIQKHSKYGPEEGNRYDGIYKVVKYYKQKGLSGFHVWRYVLRRDDPNPAPWTKQGKQRIASIGLTIIYPEGYLEVTRTNEKESDEQGDKRKGVKRFLESPVQSPTKKSVGYKLEDEIDELIKLDEANVKLWEQCRTFLRDGKMKFLEQIKEHFMCTCCQELVDQPVTTSCCHNVCLECLERSFKAKIYTCPCCRTALNQKSDLVVNVNLYNALLSLFPGYEVGR